MIDRVVSFAVRQRLLILIFAALLIGLGIYSLVRLPIDAVPDVTNIQVQINTTVPTLAPVEVEKLITYPIEVAMSGLPRVEEIRSLSKFGLSQVTVVFDDDADIYWARQLVLERLQAAREQIPPGLGDPIMGPISTGLGEIYQYVIEGKGHDLTELRTVQDWIVKPQLRTVPGVTEVNSFGGFVKQYQVLVDPSKLLSYRLTLRQVFEALARNNANAGGAFIEHNQEQYLIRGVGWVQTMDDIRNIVVTAENGTPVLIRDLAQVQIGPEIRQGAVTKDGKGEVVVGIAMMLMRENSRAVVNRVKERIHKIEQSLPSGVRLVSYYDRTELVNRTIHTVEKNLFEGGLLVIAVLLILLGNLRAAIIVASAIPLSMLFAAIGMVRFGISGNLMSLGAIDFGLIVDGAVVTVENTIRHLAERRRAQERPISRSEILDVVFYSVKEVGRPVVFAVGIIIMVYLPILSLRGIEGKMFKPMAETVVLALAGALLLTLTLIPALSAIFLKGTVAETENFPIRKAKSIYAPLLRAAVKHRKATVTLAIFSFAAGLVVFPFLGSEFVPKLDEGSVAISALRLPSTSLSESARIAAAVERTLLAFPEVVTVVSKTGRAEIATDPMGAEHTDIFVMLKPLNQWKTAGTKEELIARMKDSLKDFPGMVFGFSQPIELRVSELIAGVRSDVAVKIFGDDMSILRDKADQVAGILRTILGAADTKAEQVTGLPVLQIRIKRDLIARYGLNIADVQEVVETAIGGKAATQVIEGEKRFDLTVRFIESARKDFEEIRNILVLTPSGLRVPLATIADIYVEEGPAQISREHSQRRIVVETNVRGRDLGGFVREAEQAVQKSVRLPPGYFFEWGGQFENLQRARNRLMIVVPLALFLIFVLLFSAFNSVRQAALVFTGVPLAVTGGVFALLVRGMPFSISAGVGFIALFGVAVLNGVVMVSYINKLRDEGSSLDEAIVNGAMLRLRPVLMTALVASLGFVPMALATGTGAEVQKPLATVVIGGLITSTLLTLLVLPTIYGWFEEKRPEVEI